jgi:hypothetical protein
MGKSALLWFERLIAVALAFVFVAAMLPGIRHEGATADRARLHASVLATALYVAVAVVPVLLVLVGQRGRWRVRVIGWCLLVLLVGAVMIF